MAFQLSFYPNHRSCLIVGDRGDYLRSSGDLYNLKHVIIMDRDGSMMLKTEEEDVRNAKTMSVVDGNTDVRSTYEWSESRLINLRNMHTQSGRRIIECYENGNFNMYVFK